MYTLTMNAAPSVPLLGSNYTDDSREVSCCETTWLLVVGWQETWAGWQLTKRSSAMTPQGPCQTRKGNSVATRRYIRACRVPPNETHDDHDHDRHDQPQNLDNQSHLCICQAHFIQPMCPEGRQGLDATETGEA